MNFSRTRAQQFSLFKSRLKIDAVVSFYDAFSLCDIFPNFSRCKIFCARALTNPSYHAEKVAKLQKNYDNRKLKSISV